MKNLKIIKQDSLVQTALFDSDKGLEEFVKLLETQHPWGKPERWVLHKDEPMAETYDEADVIAEEIREFTPAIPAVLDEQGVEITPAIPAVAEKWVKLKAEYTVEIEDISAQVAQQEINAEALAYLASTDWLIIREVDAGVPCPAEIKAERAAARARVVR